MSEKLELRAGAYYRTRGGKKAFVAAVLLPNPFGADATYSVFGYITGGSGERDRQAWNRDGLEWADQETDTDLVAEWREPEQLELELVMLRTPKGKVTYATSHLCTIESVAPDTVIGRKRVTLTEGEGVS